MSTCAGVLMFGVVFVVPMLICLGCAWWTLERYSRREPLPFDPPLTVGLAGFSVFPFLNWLLAITALVACVVCARRGVRL